MKKRIALVAAIAFAANAGAPSLARHGHYAAHHHAHRTVRTADGSEYYTNVNGHTVHRPVFTSHAPGGATARCFDGSYSFSENHRGTCSHHGGVRQWL